MYWIYYTTPKFINLLSLNNVARNYTNAVCQFGAELLVYFNSIFTKMGSMAHITIWHVKWPLCPNRGLDVTTTLNRPRANIRAIREGAIYSAKEQRVYSHVHLHQTDYISRIKVRKYRLRFGGSIYKMYTFRINPCLNNAYRIFLCWPKVSIRGRWCPLCRIYLSARWEPAISSHHHHPHQGSFGMLFDCATATTPEKYCK